MEIDETAGVFRLNDTEQDAFGLADSEWPINQPFELVDTIQQEVNRLFAGDPSEFPAGARRSEILGRHALGHVVKILSVETFMQIQPYLDRHVIETAEDIIADTDAQS